MTTLTTHTASQAVELIKELNLIASVLRGYPESTAQSDALRAVHRVAELSRPLEVAAPVGDAQLQALWDEACKDSPTAPGWCRHLRFGRAVVAASRAPVASVAVPVLVVSSTQFKRMRAGDDHIKAWLPPATSAEDMLLYAIATPVPGGAGGDVGAAEFKAAVRAATIGEALEALHTRLQYPTEACAVVRSLYTQPPAQDAAPVAVEAVGEVLIGNMTAILYDALPVGTKLYATPAVVQPTPVKDGGVQS